MAKYIIFFALLFSVPGYAASFLSEGDVIGEVTQYTVKSQDTLYSIARRFDVGIVEILAANPGIDPWQPETGTVLTLPTQHILPEIPYEGIVLNLSELRLFYFASDRHVLSFPIGIGKEGWETPLGETTIARKRKDPTWVPPPSIRKENPNLPDFIPPGPENPMGAYALNLGWQGYAIHGTNRPYGVGKRSSHGCIRLYPEDIAMLFGKVLVGTKVTVVDQPYKIGWRGAALYLEVTPTQEQSDMIAEYREPEGFRMPDLYRAIQEKAGDAVEIDWRAVDRIAEEHNGLPGIIAQGAQLTAR